MSTITRKKTLWAGIERIRNSPEFNVIRKCIHQGDIVFDIGANVGAWSLAVIKSISDVDLHIFEPIAEVYTSLEANLHEQASPNNYCSNQIAIGDTIGIKTFYYYKDTPTLSGFYRRIEEERAGRIKTPVALAIKCITLDEYCKTKNIPRINFLKIDVEGNELNVLKGAQHLLLYGYIDFIQFEYGGTYLDANITLKSIYDLLVAHEYDFFIEDGNGLRQIRQWHSAYEDFAYKNLLAVNNRLTAWLLGQKPIMLNLESLCRKNNIKPRGVIHIGAHEGKELATYQRLGCSPILFIEANPTVYQRLIANVARYANVHTANYAITDGQTENVVLRITNMDQSSSILRLKEHMAIYPGIVETEQITIPARSLDNLLEELGLAPNLFNIRPVRLRLAVVTCGHYLIKHRFLVVAVRRPVPVGGRG